MLRFYQNNYKTCKQIRKCDCTLKKKTGNKIAFDVEKDSDVGLDKDLKSVNLKIDE